jgi:GWxTD domain-containing protein
VLLPTHLSKHLRAGVTAAALLLTGLAARSGAEDLPPLRSTRPPGFTADLAISVDDQARPGVGITISLPHGELQWVKVPNGYAAGAEFTVVLRPVRGGRLYGDVWNRRVAVATFAATRAPGAMITERRTLAVPPGRYRVEVSVRDLSSDVGSDARDDLDLPDYARMPIGVADLQLGVADSLGFRTVPGRRFGLEVSRLGARVALFDRRPGAWPRTYPFRYRILDDTGEELVTGSQDVTLKSAADSVLIRPSRSDLFIGDYRFEIELTDGRSRWRIDRTFEVEESGPPRGRDFERLLEPLSYIAEPGEIERLRALPADDQARGWEEFWRRRDPSPETPRNEALLEFFRRLRYCESHFQGFGPGWRSDMGRIYIRYGPPDQVDTRQANSTSGQVEVWYYNSPYRRFVFVDREGFGRFTLLNTELD